MLISFFSAIFVSTVSETKFLSHATSMLLNKEDTANTFYFNIEDIGLFFIVVLSLQLYQ